MRGQQLKFINPGEFNQQGVGTGINGGMNTLSFNMRAQRVEESKLNSDF